MSQDPKGFAPVGHETDWITWPRLLVRSALTKNTVLLTPITTTRFSGMNVSLFCALALSMPGGMIISEAPGGKTNVHLCELELVLVEHVEVEVDVAVVTVELEVMLVVVELEGVVPEVVVV